MLGLLPTCCSISIYKAVYVLHDNAFNMSKRCSPHTFIEQSAKDLLIRGMTYVSLVALKHIIDTKDTNGHIWQKKKTRGKTD